MSADALDAVRVQLADVPPLVLTAPEPEPPDEDTAENARARLREVLSPRLTPAEQARFRAYQRAKHERLAAERAVTLEGWQSWLF